MGAYFLVVNPARRQYLDPGRFGEGIKYASVLRGDYCIQALKLLVADCYQRKATSFRGAWLGDPIILASDDSGLPDPGGLVTATADDPRRNLNAMAQAEFTNISYRALAEICREFDTAAELAARSRDDTSLLIDLAGVVEQYRVDTLEHALNEAVGHPWRKAYNLALAEAPWWQPLPPIDWPL
jgi:hypothetical protein